MYLQWHRLELTFGQRSRRLGDYQFIPANAQSSHLMSPSCSSERQACLLSFTRILDVRELDWKSLPSS